VSDVSGGKKAGARSWQAEIAVGGATACKSGVDASRAGGGPRRATSSASQIYVRNNARPVSCRDTKLLHEAAGEHHATAAPGLVND